MNIERLRKIISYSEKNHNEIGSMVKKFCSFSGVDPDANVLNIMQIARSSLLKKDFFIFEIPFADHEIGALCYKGDAFGYVVINTSLPKVNTNFAIAHEIYHVFFQEQDFISKVEFSNDRYYEHEEEYAANLFAGMLLMPEISFRRMYDQFKKESSGNELDTIVRLMAYYEVPYMAALIRCFELNLPEPHENLNVLLSVTRDDLRKKLCELWLDDRILNASGKDDYLSIEKLVEKFGQEYIKDSYINDRTLRIVLQNMRALYQKIKGE